jgi:hypothetical protein
VTTRKGNKAMTYTIQKTRFEKIKDIQKAKSKADFDLVLYWNFKTIEKELFEDVDNTKA